MQINMLKLQSFHLFENYSTIWNLFLKNFVLVDSVLVNFVLANFVLVSLVLVNFVLVDFVLINTKLEKKYLVTLSNLSLFLWAKSPLFSQNVFNKMDASAFPPSDFNS